MNNTPLFLDWRSENTPSQAPLPCSHLGIFEWTYDANISCLFFPPLLSKHLGFKIEMSEKRIVPIHDEDMQILSHLVDALNDSSKIFTEYKVRFKTSDDKITYFLFRNRTANAKDGIMIDITQIVTAYEKSSQKAHDTSKFLAIGKMAGSIAHEINNPISIIRMNAEILSTSESLRTQPLKVIEKCQKIIATADRMTSIVRALRSISATTKKPNFTWIQFQNLIDDVLEFCQHKLKEENVDLEVDIQTVQGLKFFMDHAQITQSLINLLNNSCDAIKDLPERWIRLRSTLEDDFLSITITDSGKGIPEHIAAQMADQLFTTKNSKGLGLGLSLVSAYINSHCGSMHYQLLNGHTTFTIKLPLNFVQRKEDITKT